MTDDEYTKLPILIKRKNKRLVKELFQVVGILIVVALAVGGCWAIDHYLLPEGGLR